MSNLPSVINLGELSKPATVLIEKISDAIGGIFEPWQIRRVSEAEADAQKNAALAQIQITDMHRRAVRRWIQEEAKKQDNIESITKKALPDVGEQARPQDVEDDWITNFFDKCQLISDQEMQALWAKVLADQANTPGKYSKRTVNLLASLDKSDAELFTRLCSFAWIMGALVPLVYGMRHEVYAKAGISFPSLVHLETIGLIRIGALTGYSMNDLPQKLVVSYYGQAALLEFEKPEENDLHIGQVMLSKAGEELARICGSKPNPEFKDYVIKMWRGMGIKVTEDIGAKDVSATLPSPPDKAGD